MEGLIEKARTIASSSLEGMKRDNGRPFLDHPDAVARILSDEIGLGEESIAAVYLHEATRQHPELIENLRDSFPAEVCTMADCLNKISQIKPKDTRLEAENYKRLIVSYSRDPRVTVIKIADRLEIMRCMDFLRKIDAEKKCLETLLLYIPLAHQLGLYNIKSEMEDIYFKYADIEQYRAITNKLKAGEKDREKLTLEFIEPLKQKLSEEGISYKLKIRTKTAYSIWRKMQTQKVPFEGVFDVFAIRFIIDCAENPETEKELCWKVFSLVTEEYESDTNRLRDWISNPKPNGYESLHITVKNREGAYLEVQIRTRRMDDIAENGLASHWAYKGIKKETTLDNWLNSVRNFLEHKSSLSDITTADDGTQLSSDVFVFTPTGELRKLAGGATVLDFAFDIHSNLGLKCAGGLINGKSVPIRECLKTGDYVEIIKNKNQKPSRDWLNFVVTSKARNKIRQFIKEEEYQKASEGKDLLTSKFHKWKLELLDEDLAALMKRHRQKNLNSFYEAVGDGRIDPLEVKKFVEFRHETHKVDIQTPEALIPQATANSSRKDTDVLFVDAANIGQIQYKLAKCCSPVFGDDIFGFVTRFDGIKIHKISCPNAARLLDEYPYRIIKAKWSKDDQNK